MNNNTEQWQAGMVVLAGARAAEAQLLREISTAADAARAQPQLLAKPLRVLVPSAALRKHISFRIVQQLGAAAGLQVQTLQAAAHEIIAAATAETQQTMQAVQYADALTVRRLAHQQPALRRALEALNDGYGTAIGVVNDLLDAGLTTEMEDAAGECIAALPGAEQTRARAKALCSTALATRRTLAQRGQMHRADLFRNATQQLENNADVFPARGVWVHGVADATGVQLDFVEALLRACNARVLLCVPPDPAATKTGAANNEAPGARFTARMRERFAAFELPAATNANAAENTPRQITYTQASGTHAEVRAAAQQIRRLIKDGAAPESIALVVRDFAPYRTAFACELRRAALPFSAFAVRTSTQRDEGGHTEASGITGFNGPAARQLAALLALLEQTSRASVDTWLDVFLRAGRNSPAVAARLRAALHGVGAGRLAAVAALAPETCAQHEAARGITARRFAFLRGAAQRTIARLDELARADAAAAHLATLHKLVHRELGWREETPALDEWHKTATQLQTELVGEGEVTGAELLPLLKRALQGAGALPLGGRGGGIRLGTVADMRGCTAQHLFVLGLNREIFPRPINEDPLLPDATREKLETVLPDIPIKRRGHDEERYLFAQLLSAAPRVHLSWLAVDDAGRERAASPFVERLRLLNETPGEATPELTQLCVAQGFAVETPLEVAIQSGLAAGVESSAPWQRALAHALQHGPAAMQPAQAAELAAHRGAVLQELEGAAGARTRLGPHFGLLGAPPDASEASDASDASDATESAPALSVTKLEALHACPWQSFLQRHLHLQAPPDALAALPAFSKRALGNVVHNVLEQIIRRAGVPPRTLEEAAAAEARRAEWPPPEELDALLLSAARAAALQEGAAHPAYARALAQTAQPYLARVYQFDWQEGAPPVVGAEVQGEVQLPGLPRAVRFRADRADKNAAGLTLVDYKAGRAISTAKRGDSQRKHLLQKISAGMRLQAAVYAAAAAAGRYLFAAPEIAAEHAAPSVESADKEARAALQKALQRAMAAWQSGVLPPRLVARQGDAQGPACGRCTLREACLFGDSTSRRRLRQRMQSVLEGAGEAAAAERGLYQMWSEA